MAWLPDCWCGPTSLLRRTQYFIWGVSCRCAPPRIRLGLQCCLHRHLQSDEPADMGASPVLRIAFAQTTARLCFHCFPSFSSGLLGGGKTWDASVVKLKDDPEAWAMQRFISQGIFSRRRSISFRLVAFAFYVHSTHFISEVLRIKKMPPQHFICLC